MSTKKITILQMSMLLIMTIGLVNHVTILPLLLDAAKKDAWISIIFAIPFCIAWICVPFYIVKKTNQAKLMDWFQSNRTGWFKPIFTSIFTVYLTASIFISAREVITWTKVAYLPQTPMFVTRLTLLILCVYAASKGIKAIAIATGILLPFVWVLGFFVMSSNFQVKRYSLLFPLFTTGPHSIMLCMIYVSSSLMEMILIVLLQHHMKETVKWWHLALVVLILLGLTLGPLMGALAAFGYEAVKLKYPAYEQWRLVQLGAFVSHVDFLSIYQWISGAFIRISLSLFLLLDLFSIRKKNHLNMGYILFGIAMLLAMTFIKLSDASYTKLISIFYLTSFGVILFFSLILFLLVWVKTRKKGASS